WLASVAETRRAARARMRATLGPYERVLDDLRGTLPRDAIVVRDVTIPATTWGGRLFETYVPRTALYSATYAIGMGFGLAIGAAVAPMAVPVTAPARLVPARSPPFGHPPAPCGRHSGLRHGDRDDRAVVTRFVARARCIPGSGGLAGGNHVAAVGSWRSLHRTA